MTPSLENVQGLIVWAYTHPYSRHLLLKMEDAAAGRDLFKKLSPLVTPATNWGNQKPPHLLNLGITYNGLKALEVDPAIVEGLTNNLNGFPLEFRNSGGTNPDFSGAAGFTGASDPSRWWLGSEPSFTSAEIHLILHLYALTPQGLDLFTTRLRTLFPATIRELRPLAGGRTIDCQRLPDGKDHFGYKDGIAQPKINWPGSNAASFDADFREFLLGYSTDAYQSAPPGPFARDGSYLVFQQIYQDVAYFNQVLKTEARNLSAPTGVLDKQEWLAAKLVGRWRSGAPLAAAPLVDDPAKVMENDFGYAADLQGYKCPFSAHIRVANPRDQKINPTSRPVPRLIRRGMPYGPPLAGEVDDGEDRGLVGLFLCGSINRQYLKLAKWIHRNDFSSVYSDKTAQDPLQGNRDLVHASSSFRIPTPNGEILLQGLKSFVRTQGAAFCFLPSLSTIQDLGAGKYT